LCFNGASWIRIKAEVVLDQNRAAIQDMLEHYPSLKGMYQVDDGNTEVFYLKNGVATISSFTSQPKTITF
jgi:uncharacterized pyridoxamine 5'-phosphate oxidase family protein